MLLRKCPNHPRKANKAGKNKERKKGKKVGSEDDDSIFAGILIPPTTPGRWPS